MTKLLYFSFNINRKKYKFILVNFFVAHLRGGRWPLPTLPLGSAIARAHEALPILGELVLATAGEVMPAAFGEAVSPHPTTSP